MSGARSMNVGALALPSPFTVNDALVRRDRCARACERFRL
jgi:hypothetical protein